MTVRENLEMGAYVRGKRGAVAEALERCYALFPVLREKAGQPASQLSGGQQQMVAIGRALMSRPKLLLLDEPFLGVAPIIIEEVMGALQRLSDEGVTLLLVEQNMHRAMDFVARAYVIENGRTVLEGTRASLLGDAELHQQVPRAWSDRGRPGSPSLDLAAGVLSPTLLQPAARLRHGAGDLGAGEPNILELPIAHR